MKALALWWSRPTPSGFLTRFALIGGTCFAVYAFPFELFGVQQDWLTGYLSAYAHLAGLILHPLDASVVVNGNVIEGRFPLQIVRTCDAAEVSILFASAVLAFPARAGQKLLALAVGLPSLVLANLARICCLYFIGVHRPTWFKTSHEEVWPLVLVAFAAFVFLRAVRFMQSNAGVLEPVRS